MKITTGTERQGQDHYLKLLKPFGYTRQQAFPDNYTKGTNRFMGTDKRDTSVVVNAFNPTLKSDTYWSDDLPIITQTYGYVGNICIWAGIYGLKEAMRRKPTANPLRTDILRDYFREKGMNFIEGINSLKGRKEITAKPPTYTKNPQQPGRPWLLGLPFGATEDMIEEWLAREHEKYYSQVRDIIVAEKELKDVGYGEDEKIELLNKVDAATPSGMADAVFNHRLNIDSNKWHLVVIANANEKKRAMRKGFVILDEMRALDIETRKYPKGRNPFPANVLAAIEITQSERGELLRATTDWLIKPPAGVEIKKSVSWQTVLKASGGYRGGHARIPLGAGGGDPPKKPPTGSGPHKPSDCPEGQYWNPKTQRCEDIINPKTPIKHRVSGVGVPRDTPLKESAQGLQAEVNPESDRAEKMVKSWLLKYFMALRNRRGRGASYSEEDIKSMLDEYDMHEINEMFSQENRPTEDDPLMIEGWIIPIEVWDGIHNNYQIALAESRVGMEFPESPLREDLDVQRQGAMAGNIRWSELTENERIYINFLEWYEFMRGNINETDLATIDDVFDRFRDVILEDSSPEEDDSKLNDTTLIEILRRKKENLKREAKE